MPRGDGTGPTDKGVGKGRGRGRGQGKGRMGGPSSAGPGGNCVCPNCGYKTAHITGQPCNEMICPECGAKITRDQQILEGDFLYKLEKEESSR